VKGEGYHDTIVHGDAHLLSCRTFMLLVDIPQSLLRMASATPFLPCYIVFIDIANEVCNRPIS